MTQPPHGPSREDGEPQGAAEVPARKGLPLIIAGSIVMIPLAAAIFVAALYVTMKDIPDRQYTWTVGQEQSVELPGKSTFDVGGHRGALPPGAEPPYETPCTITGPQGKVRFDTYTRGTATTGSTSPSVTDQWSLGSFRTQTAGSYRVTCEPFASVDVTSRTAVFATLRDAGWGVLISFAVSGLIGLIGMGLLIAGIVQRVRTGRAAHAVEVANATSYVVYR